MAEIYNINDQTGEAAMRQLLFLVGLVVADPGGGAANNSVTEQSSEFMIVSQGGTSCGSYVLAFRPTDPVHFSSTGQEYATPTNSKIE